ncbi:hypothetical protein [Comamonas terrigena]|uniref:hypothetical protein n=1 Tax=Comamonas terrigena TaxID=32013 RepID=UPI0028A1C6EA|nr:hypothetical protein [Comamonas terrigena]
MKETGLMFKAPLVRAILAGQKTQTRRVVKWKNLHQGLNLGFSGLGVEKTPLGWVLRSDTRTSSEWRCSGTPCPMGNPGDRIYVRETFVQGYKTDPATGALRECDEDGNDVPMSTWYRATDGGISWSDDDGWETNVPWKPAIHMPKALARIWLEINGVRVQRLQSITEADCIAEGATGGHGAIPNYAYSATPLEHFRHIWESTGGDWTANPWVWVVDFKTISTTGQPT